MSIDRGGGEVTRADAKRIHREYMDRPHMGNRIVAVGSLIFNLLLDDELVDANPFARIEPHSEDARDRAMTRAEIRQFWEELPKGARPATCQALRFMLITANASRRGAVEQMRWNEISGRTWKVPSENFKGRREFWVPLSEEALEVLEPRRGWQRAPRR